MIKIEVLTRSKSASWIFDFFKLSFVGSSPTLNPEENHPTLFFVFIHARVHAFLLYILYGNTFFIRFCRVEYTYFCLFPLLSPKIAKIPLLIIRHLQRKCIFFEFFCKNIWSIQKFVVSLHPLSLKNGARPKRAQAMIFEKMSIHNKIVVQELK